MVAFVTIRASIAVAVAVAKIAIKATIGTTNQTAIITIAEEIRRTIKIQ